jgi:hypothetical protein
VEAGGVAYARGQRRAAGVGQAGLGAGEGGRVHGLVAGFALGGVGGEFGGDRAQQPGLGGDLGGQAGEAGGGVTGVELQRGLGGLQPLAGAPGALVAVGGFGDQRSQPGLARPGQGTGVSVTLQDCQVGHAEFARQWGHGQRPGGPGP